MIWQLPHAKCTYLIFKDIFQEVNKVAQAIEVRDDMKRCMVFFVLFCFLTHSELIYQSFGKKITNITYREKATC